VTGRASQSLLHDHQCPWREHAESVERRYGEVIVQQQSLIEKQQAALGAELKSMRESVADLEAKNRALTAEVSRLTREVVGPRSERTRLPPHDRDHDDEASDEDKARRARKPRRSAASERSRETPRSRRRTSSVRSRTQ